jgi:hypothetical protein
MTDMPHPQTVDHYCNRLMDVFRDIAPCEAGEFPAFMLALSHVMGILIGRTAECEEKPIKPFLVLTTKVIAASAHGYDAGRRSRMQ